MIKDIFIHLDAAASTESRLDVALGLAQRHGAALVGLFAQSDPAVPGAIGEWPTPWYKAAAANSQQSFAAKAAAAGVTAEWHDALTGSYESIIVRVIAGARNADLAVIGQPEGGGVPVELAEQVILQGGRPVLVVPYAGRFSAIGERVMVAWNGGREAARALGDAMPILRQARDVRLECVVHSGKDQHWDLSAVAAHLSRNRVPAKVETLAIEQIGVMDSLLSRAADLGADMMVMGAHGHYGFPNLSRGAGTRFMLRHMTVPVLFSN